MKAAVDDAVLKNDLNIEDYLAIERSFTLPMPFNTSAMSGPFWAGAALLSDIDSPFLSLFWRKSVYTRSLNDWFVNKMREIWMISLLLFYSNWTDRLAIGFCKHG